MLKPVVPGDDLRASGHKCRVTLPKNPLESMGNIEVGHLDKFSSGPFSIFLIMVFSVLTAQNV